MIHIRSKIPKIIILALGLFLFAAQGFGTDFSITIRGNFPGAEGQEIRLMEYADQVSYAETEITSVKVDDNGDFALYFSRFEPQYVYFRIDHARMGIFVEPGNHYTLAFESVDFGRLNDRRNPYLDPWYFNFTIQEENNINSWITEFDDIFDAFVIDNFRAIHLGRNKNLFDQFREHTDSLFAHVENEYFRDYYRYKFANYYYMANVKPFMEVVKESFMSQAVLYQNTQYMNMLNNVFDSYVFAGSRHISITDLRSTINEQNSYHALMDSLGKDTIFRNEVFRELIMLKTLKDLHGNPTYNKFNIESILEHTRIHSKFPTHRSIAENILHRINHLRPGTAAPSLTLQNPDGKEVSFPSDFSGRFILLTFFTSWSELALLEFSALDTYYDEFSKDFAIVNISTDRNSDSYQNFAKNAHPDWHFFHFDQDFRMLDAYIIRSIPSFMIIDTKGQIISYPAPRPSDNLRTHFQFLLHQRSRQGHPHR